jgi:hypothetical protein
VLPLAIGAVVLGFPTTFHTPLSGHVCPVVAVVPMGNWDIWGLNFIVYIYYIST